MYRTCVLRFISLINDSSQMSSQPKPPRSKATAKTESPNGRKTSNAIDDSENTKVSKKHRLTTDSSEGKKLKPEKCSRIILGETGTDCAGAMNPSRLNSSHFDKPCIELARYLLGKKLVRLLESGDRLSGMIVETEAYLGVGEGDRASAGFSGKKSKRNEALFMAPGTACVYNTYGMWSCMNISSRVDGAGVLLRGLDVTEGDDAMRVHRGMKRSDHGISLKTHELCNGPSKLTMALGITKTNSDQLNLSNSPQLWLEDGGHIEPGDIIATRRVGIDGCPSKEWVQKPLRFYIRGNTSVSMRDKLAEERDDKLTEGRDEKLAERSDDK